MEKEGIENIAKTAMKIRITLTIDSEELNRKIIDTFKTDN